MKYYLAIDMGASSGRHVIGYKDENNNIILEEIYRFKTGVTDSKDGLIWHLSYFLKEIKKGIRLAFKKYKNIESLSIDTWGVDYVLLKDDKEIPPFYAYRNNRTEKPIERLHSIIPFKDLYEKTGIQFGSYNTIYQLFDDLEKGRLDDIDDFLMLSEYFAYKLSGKKAHEYTIESTSGLLNANTKKYDQDIINKLGFPSHLFKEIKQPGYVLGDLLPEIAKEVGGNCKVILGGSHDTASAFEAVDSDEDSIILSSGTWSLFGIKTKEPICNSESLKANFTNEGGNGYIRFLKNIMGMWVPTQVCKQEGLDFFEMERKCNVFYHKIFDINDESLLAPLNMKKAILKLLKNDPPKDDLELFNSIYHSLAFSYQKACEELERITGKKFNKIYVVGGGAKNIYLNSLLAKYTGKKIIPLPIEATSLGNIKIQMKA